MKPMKFYVAYEAHAHEAYIAYKAYRAYHRLRLLPATLIPGAVDQRSSLRPPHPPYLGWQCNKHNPNIVKYVPTFPYSYV